MHLNTAVLETFTCKYLKEFTNCKMMIIIPGKHPYKSVNPKAFLKATINTFIKFLYKIY